MSNIIELTDSDMGMDSDEEINKEFKVLVQCIERYMVDEKLSIGNIASSTVDLFDITIAGKSLKVKCILHPSLNAFLYKGMVQKDSLVLVKDFEFHYKDTDLPPEEIIVLKNIEVLQHLSDGSIKPDAVKSFIKYRRRKSNPLVTSRNYYLPLFNSEDFYGECWKSREKVPLKIVSLKDIQSFSIQDLAASGGTAKCPVHGVVISKSRLKHYGKIDDRKAKYPYTFSIEIEQNGWTCCVSFWNSTCFDYFNRIGIGDNILVRNYRFKNRYGQRSNAVYSGKDSNMELSINPTNPQGVIECVNEKSSTLIPYRFQNTLQLNRLPSHNDAILDVVGIVVYVGRWEREKALNAHGLSVRDFWMYRWIAIKDSMTKYHTRLKLYVCSQPTVLNNIVLGDVFIGSRMLYKKSIQNITTSPRFFYYLTTTRESQLYRISKGWCLDDIKNLPFVTYSDVMETLKVTKDCDNITDMMNDSSTLGYFSYPPLPHTLEEYKELFTQDNPFEVQGAHEVVHTIENMHMLQTIRGVCIQATVVAVEIIQDETSYDVPPKKCKRKSRKLKEREQPRPQQEEYPSFIVDHESIEIVSNLTRVGDLEVSEERNLNFLGNSFHKKNKAFLRFVLVSLNKDVSIVATFLPFYDDGVATKQRNLLQVLAGLDVPSDYLQSTQDVFKNIEEFIKKTSRFLFVLDLHYFGNNVHEVSVNRAFLL